MKQETSSTWSNILQNYNLMSIKLPTTNTAVAVCHTHILLQSIVVWSQRNLKDFGSTINTDMKRPKFYLPCLDKTEKHEDATVKKTVAGKMGRKWELLRVKRYYIMCARPAFYELLFDSRDTREGKIPLIISSSREIELNRHPLEYARAGYVFMYIKDLLCADTSCDPLRNKTPWLHIS